MPLGRMSLNGNFDYVLLQDQPLGFSEIAALVSIRRYQNEPNV